MSRPHGCDVSGATKIRNVKSAPSFVDARKALVSTLENLSFLKVVALQNGPNGAYTGEAVEIHFRDSRERPKLVFFDKFGRSRNLLKIGPISIAQAPLGFDHVTSVPTVGEILVGSLVPNTRKSHLDHVLRGWSSDGKPLYELLRILKFGTKNSEFECRSILIQPSSTLMQSPDHLKAARDDIYMTARIILWGSIRPLQVLASIQNPDRVTLDEPPTEIEITQANGIRISTSALDYFDTLTMKLADINLSEAFLNGLTLKQTYSNLGYGMSGAMQNGAMHNAGPQNGSMQNGSMQNGSMQNGPYAGNSVAYDPTTVFAVRPRTPTLDEGPYAPSSPPYAPSSPPYAPSSPPYAPSSPVNAPSSPAYAPSSPVNAPSSPARESKDQKMASTLVGLYDDI